MSAPLLAIERLRVSFPGRSGRADAVRGIDLSLEPGRTLGLVGESGSGKSVSMMATLQLLPPTARVEGSARYRGRELIGMAPAQIRRIRGKAIGVVFQDPLTALNPVLTVGEQIAEALRLHDGSLSRRAARDEALHLLEAVAVPQPARRFRAYPHEFSGGMRQRAMIAIAIANKPDILIADEPTTALDVTVQAQILELLQRLREELGLALVLITHDLGVVAGAADDIAVMYAGRIVEHGDAVAIFHASRHPYTRGLLAALPRIEGEIETLNPIEGSPPTLWSRPSGCAFHPRCPMATDVCRLEEPDLRPVGKTLAACHHAERLDAAAGVPA